MGGKNRFGTGAFQHALLPGDGQDLDLMALRATNGNGGLVEPRPVNPELTFPPCVDKAGRVLTDAVAMLEDAFPGTKVVEGGDML